MHGLAELIEKELDDVTYDNILLAFERKLFDQGKELEQRTRYAGLTDEKIMLDLFKSEHPDMHAEYAEYRAQTLKKISESMMHKFLAAGTPILFLIMVAVYLGASFLTRNWAQSWLIIIFFVTLWVDTVGIIMAKEIAAKRRLYHPIARILLALSVMMSAVFVYLTGLILFAIPHFWVVFPAGVFIMFCTDAVFAKVTDQKMRIINYLIYVPAAMPMLYVVLCGTHVLSWSPGWLLMPLAVIIDIVIIIAKLADNRKYIYKPEE